MWSKIVQSTFFVVATVLCTIGTAFLWGLLILAARSYLNLGVEVHIVFGVLLAVTAFGFLSLEVEAFRDRQKLKRGGGNVGQDTSL